MLYGPDIYSSDEDGLSDDNEYYEYKERLNKNRQNAVTQNNVESEEDRKNKQIRAVFNAISYKNKEVLINELDKGLDVNSVLEYGWAPLLLAATAPDENIITELLRRGANVNQSREEITPLMLLCNNRYEGETSSNILNCVNLLIDAGANVQVVDRKRKNALMCAAYNGHIDIVKLLLPLTDKEAQDNQRWTALFWAVDGNRTEIVDLLLKEGFNSDKTDIRGNNVGDIAHFNGFEEILQLLPKYSSEEVFYWHLNNNYFNFEEIFFNLTRNEKPQFFSDVCKILYGTRSESTIPIMYEQKISLIHFLSMNDTQLKEMGLKFPFQRSRVVGGLFKFHKHPYQQKSIPYIRKNDLYTNLDISSTVLTCIRQLIAMEASLKFILKNYKDNLSLAECKELNILIVRNHQQIKRVKAVVKQLAGKSRQWDLTLKPADRITRKRWNIPWCNLWMCGIVVSCATVFSVRKFLF